MLIPFELLFRKYNIHPKGILHIGASEGQEAPEYYRLGIRNMCFIEALPNVYELLKMKIAQYPGAIAIRACIGDEDGKEVEFNVADNGGQSSSYLDFGTHSQQHPSVHFIDKINMKTKRIDTLYYECLIPQDRYDFLNIDLQGAELLALKGMGHLIENFRWAYLEINEEEVYKGCALAKDVDEYMGKFGFKRVETKMTQHDGRNTWGDCLYRK